MTLAGRAPLVSFFAGGAFIAYGSIAGLPGTAPGQIVASVFVGAALVLFGAAYLALVLALRPGHADVLLEASLTREARSGRAAALFERTAFADVPVLRWGLCAALALIALFALAVLASDVFAWTRLGWTVPTGASRVLLR